MASTTGDSVITGQRAKASTLYTRFIIFHAIDTGCAVSSQTTTIDKSDDAGAVRTKKSYIESLAERAKDLGILCRVVVRAGSAADQILTFLRERNTDRVIMGAHSPGPVGKLLVGSVTEAVLRKAIVPVCVVGPDVVASTYRSPALRNIQCDVSTEECRRVMAIFAAELAVGQHAGLILEDTIRPQEKDRILADRTINQIENELPSLVPAELQENIDVRTKVAFGYPT